MGNSKSFKIFLWFVEADVIEIHESEVPGQVSKLGPDVEWRFIDYEIHEYRYVAKTNVVSLENTFSPNASEESSSKLCTYLLLHF